MADVSQPTGVLALVETPYRGSTERAYADCFYLARVLTAQVSSLDVLLRGEAVLIARATGARTDAHDADDADDAQHTAGPLAPLLAAGGCVFVDGEDAARLGVAAADLLPGVRLLAPDAPSIWPDYASVWFL